MTKTVNLNELLRWSDAKRISTQRGDVEELTFENKSVIITTV